MGFPILVRCHLYIESGPYLSCTYNIMVTDGLLTMYYYRTALHQVLGKFWIPLTLSWQDVCMCVCYADILHCTVPVYPATFKCQRMRKEQTDINASFNSLRPTDTCVCKLTIIGSDNGMSPGRRPAIIWTNAGILLISPVGTNFNEILIKIHRFSFKKMHLKISSAKRWPFCLGLNELIFNFHA